MKSQTKRKGESFPLPVITGYDSLVHAINARPKYREGDGHFWVKWCEHIVRLRAAIIKINQGEGIPKETVEHFNELFRSLRLECEDGLALTAREYIRRPELRYQDQEGGWRGLATFFLQPFTVRFTKKDEASLILGQYFYMGAMFTLRYGHSVYQALHDRLGSDASRERIQAALEGVVWIRVCPVCDQLFIRSRLGNVFCSPKCARRGSYDHHWPPGSEARREYEREKKRRQRERSRTMSPMKKSQKKTKT